MAAHRTIVVVYVVFSTGRELGERGNAADKV